MLTETTKTDPLIQMVIAGFDITLEQREFLFKTGMVFVRVDGTLGLTRWGRYSNGFRKPVYIIKSKHSGAWCVMVLREFISPERSVDFTIHDSVRYTAFTRHRTQQEAMREAHKLITKLKNKRKR